ncbi:MAG: hypothetical protein ACRDNS_03280 [Trebonia sp.]
MAVEIAAIVERMQTAGQHWETALDAHALAPPDAAFPGRLRALSQAAAEQAEAFKLAAQGGLGWRARSVEHDFALAPELTPGMTRPGPEQSWARFDQAVAGLARALAGSSPAELAAAFTELSQSASALADQTQPLYRAGRLAV